MFEVSIKKNFSKNKFFEYELKTSVNRIVLFGPSGSGKSNLMKMIAGFFNPDEGIIKINGSTYFKNKSKIPIYKRRVGYLPQEYTLFPHMTVEENILYGVKINKLSLNKEKYYTLIKKLELYSKLYLFPHQLSGGEKQRVALARAILINPDVLLFDEPFSSLDKAIKDKLRDTVLDILDETGTKAIFVTHDFEDAFLLGKEVYIISNGKIIENGTADKIFNRPEFVETAKMINMKNIWDINFFKKFFKDIKFSSCKFVGLKSENVVFFSKLGKTFECEIEKIKKLGSIVELILNYKGLKIISSQPVYYLNQLNVSPKTKIKISIEPNNFIPLKNFYNTTKVHPLK